MTGTCQFPGCYKPVYPASNYCSKTHRDSPWPGQVKEATCKFPGCPKPVYPASDYCSKAHRDAPTPTQGPTCIFPGCIKPAFPGGTFCSKTHRDTPFVQEPTCHFPGCSKPVYPASDYCSRTHRDNASSEKPTPSRTASKGPGICLFPDCSKPAFPGGTYCSKYHRDHAPSRPPLEEIVRSDPKFQDIENQFTQKWLHKTTPCPTVRHIYRISPPAEKVSAYEAYRSDVSQSTCLKDGNQNRRFHGTNRMCTVGDYGSTTLCQSQVPECALCNIVRTSFRLNLAGGNKPWKGKKTGRFGLGIYTSATSSKSNDYSENKGASSSNKAMFLTKVVVGKAKKYKTDQPGLTGPPSGYHSVIGEPDIFGSLNYDELIVYREDAVIPAYLIIYDKT